MSRLAIIGSNDLGKLIAHHALQSGWNVVGFFDNKKEKGIAIDNYGDILGAVDQIELFYKGGKLDCIINGVGYTQFEYRQKVFDSLKGKVPFANVIHNNTYVDKSVSLGEGIFILPGTTLDMNVKIRDNVLLNTGCNIAHDSEIMEHTFIAPGVTIAGNVQVGNCNFIGVGSTILDGIRTCPKVVVGGGALVSKNITDPGVYIGIPARRIKDNMYFK
ncbi:MAG: acetyltransferase [Chitinophagaceae bacterium]